MKFLTNGALFFCFLMSCNNTIYASDWTPLEYKIGKVLDQVEHGDNLLLISYTGITYNAPIIYNYSINSFDGVNMTKLGDFYATFSCTPDMNIAVFENKIYIGGNFESINGDTTIHYIVSFENNTFNKVGGGLSKVTNGAVYDLEVFGDALLVAGKYRISNINYGSTYKCDFLTKYSTNGWQKFSGSEFSNWCYLTFAIMDIKIINSEIIVFGDFDLIDYSSVKQCAKYSNGSWIPMDLNASPYVSKDMGINNLNGSPCYINHHLDYYNAYSYIYNPYLEMWNGSSWDSIYIDYKDHYISGAISFNGQLFIASQQFSSARTLFNIGVIDLNNGKTISDFEYYYNSTGDVFYPANFFIYKSKLYSTSYYTQSDVPSLAVYNLSNSNATSINAGSNSSNAEEFQIYPNPASKTIFLDGMKGDIESVQVISLMGTVIFEFPKGNDQGLNIETLPEGKYFLKIQQSGNILIRPFEKMD